MSGAIWEKRTAVLLAAGHRSSHMTLEDSASPATKLELTDFALAGFSIGGGEVARCIGNTARRA
jgi:hypothetical protein